MHPIRTIARPIPRFAALVLTAAVSATLNTGCAHKRPAPSARQNSVETIASTMPTTESTTEPTTNPTSEPATIPTTAPGEVVIPPVKEPVVEPPTAKELGKEPSQTRPTTDVIVPPVAPPTTIATTQAAVEPATKPTTEPVAAGDTDEPYPKDPDQIAADALLADKLCGYGELAFVGDMPKAAHEVVLRHEAAVNSAAFRLSPDETRFARLAAEAYRRLGDDRAELDMLLQVISTDKNDETSFCRALDLHLRADESSKQRVDYLTDVMGRNTMPNLVPPAVRAHAAYLLARTLVERGEDQGAETAIRSGLRENPVSGELLRLKYDLLTADTPDYERLTVLFDLLRSNPVQARYSRVAADLIAKAGLAKESLDFYVLCNADNQLMGQPDPNVAVELAAQYYLAEQRVDARKLNDSILESGVDAPSAWFLQMAFARAGKNPVDIEKTRQAVLNVLSNRLVNVVNLVGADPGKKATTRPIPSPGEYPLPDLAPTAKKITESKNEQWKQAFVETVSDLALFDVYFADQPVAGSRLADVLRTVIPTDAPEVARIDGLVAVANKNTPEATAKLTPIIGTDPIAAIGLIKAMMTDPAQVEKAEKIARQLMQDHPSGLIGVIVQEAVASPRVKLIVSKDGENIRQLVGSFPADWLTLPFRPGNFYSVILRPVTHGVYYGEPLLVEVTIQNQTGTDLTIGDDGVIKPGLLFRLNTINAPVKEPSQFNAYDDYAGPAVLRSRGTARQIVRVDQTDLLRFLDGVVGPKFELTGAMFVNQSVNMAGGYQAQFSQNFIRFATIHNPPAVTKIVRDLADGRPEQKMDALALVRPFVSDIAAAKNPTPAQLAELGTLMDAVHKARTDGNPSISAYAGWCECLLNGQPGARAEIVHDLADSPDWRHRQVALALCSYVDADVERAVTEQLANDKQSTVRADAAAVRELVDVMSKNAPPTTRP